MREDGRVGDTFVIAAWSAAAFGLLEGALLCAARQFPALLAAHQVPVGVLWAAPLLDLVLFGLVASVLVVPWPGVPRRWRAVSLPAAWGLFTVLGVFAVVSALKVIHVVAALSLSLGVAAAAVRRLRGREEEVTRALARRIGWIPVVILAAAGASGGWEAGREALLARRLPPAARDAASVLVVVLDTVRWDRVGRRGVSLTPNIDRLAAQGAQFAEAWAASSWSLASQATILTGRYPHEHGAAWPALRLSVPTLAEYFAARGYATGAFSGNAAWITPEHLGRGFVRFEAYRLEDLLRRTAYGRILDRALETVGLHSAGRGKKAARVTAEFAAFVDEHRGRPFFAYLCYMDVNQAFHHRRLNRGFWRPRATVPEVIDAYETGLRELDAEIGRLIGELERRGLLERTVIVLTSDHGESFGAGAGDHDPPGHGTSVYPEQARVPLLVVYPPAVPAGVRVERVVSQRDIAATILQVLGLPHLQSPFGGEPLPVTASERGTTGPPGALVTLRYGGRDLRSVVWERWQYILDRGRSPAVEELYDRLADPAARQSVAAGEVLATGRRLLSDLLPADQVRAGEAAAARR